MFNMPPWLVIIFQPQTKMDTSNNRLRKDLLSSLLSSSSSASLTIFKLNNLVLIIALLSILLFNCTLCNGLPCQSNSWWDSLNNQCIPCTECNESETIVLRPCQVHQDTICGSIHDLEIDYVFSAKTESNWKDRRKDGEIIRQDYNKNNNENLSNLKLEDEELEDWWEMFLIAIIIIFLLFFIFVAYLSFHHMRRWRQIERRLDRAEKNHIGLQHPGNLYIEETNTK
ncbi:tumor necrosis factor receptor superfamily member wengen isoform X2 [Condylostylus longicornis]|uniref:tumor necrosis factor receptor superfamily member wengen isoform X2 n=1 Tax=Condylostylus longicornis TaxID=2530218 RepID=UPI00244DDF48|nr:tumor necrosis factor receptor superfamily member wengen isoform X2 [Condylostylus longicornis]